MCLVFLLMCAKFEGNLITRLHFIAVFCKCAKRKRKKGKEEKKNEKKERFFEGLYFRNGWRNLFQAYMPAPTQRIWSCLVKRPRSYERRVNILTLCVHAPFSWVARHTTICLDINMYIYVCLHFCEYIAYICASGSDDYRNVELFNGDTNKYLVVEVSGGGYHVEVADKPLVSSSF